MWWGPTKAFCCSVNVHGVVVLCSGGGNTWTLFVLTKLSDLFAPRGDGEWKTVSNCMGMRPRALCAQGARPRAQWATSWNFFTAWFLPIYFDWSKTSFNCVENWQNLAFVWLLCVRTITLFEYFPVLTTLICVVAFCLSFTWFLASPLLVLLWRHETIQL